LQVSIAKNICDQPFLTPHEKPVTDAFMKPTGFPFGIVFALAVLDGCAVGPNFRAPPAPAVSGYTPSVLPVATVPADGKSQQFAPAADIPGDWWTLYHSPELSALISAALAHNPNLQASEQNLIAAQETVREAQGGLFPTVSGSFQAQRDQVSPAQLAGSGQNVPNNFSIAPYTLYNASLSVSYAPSLFGLAQRGIEQEQAAALYQRDELEAAYLSLTANIVTAAVTEASLQAQIDATNQIIGDETQQLKILQIQYKLGGVSSANVLSEEATLAQAKTELPPLQAQLAQTRDQLADYVGAFPADFHEADFTLGGLHLPETLPVSVPSALVAQRPDIAAAAAQLHEYTAAVGVADANMLPQISLTGNIGHDALTTGSLFTPQTLVWSLVAGVTQPIFEGGQLAAKRKIAIAQMRQSGAQYETTVLAAFQNVADALQALQYDAATLQAAQAARDAAWQSLQVTQAQYRDGAQPFTAVLTAQVTYQNAAVTQVKAVAARLTDTAALYQAMGGGWWHRNDVTQTCCGIIP
jgi:NodT family efflux transporter outer membrane factor (OMF) lipoprotein